ncbi:MAG: tetratricopeptide repeat protein, partial [Cyanobacteria bacterium NC_groundwater_1444_Ag_S-0.65um_54_12]|nr:tetratricopeptide repeat protein [Cyanobacteria bacterium NC_groundwater_1444_Ag_S-0.65um_54_12]
LPAQRRDAAFAVVNELFFNIAQQAPLILELDDLHWTDSSSLEWLRSFLLRLEDKPDLPLLVILQFRPSTDKDFAEDIDPNRWSIELGPMPMTDCWRMVQIVLGDGIPVDDLESLLASPAKPFIDQVIQRSGGNPFFLSELLVSLVENKVLQRGSLGWEVHSVAGELTLPNTLAGIVAARLDRLSREQRQVVQIASVIGREFELTLLEQLTGLPNISELLAELILGDVLTTCDNGCYAFTHAMLQEVAYQSLLISTRRELHRQVGQALEERLGVAVDRPQILARHFNLADRPDKAMKYLFLSGKKARLGHKLAEASACFAQVLRKIGEEEQQFTITAGEVILNLSECEIISGQYAAAREHLEQALQQNPGPPFATQIIAKLAEVLERQGDFAQGIECIDRLRLSGGPRDFEVTSAECEPQLLGRLRVIMATLKLRIGNFAEATLICENNLRLLDESVHAERGLTLSILGLCHQKIGKLDPALSSHAHALALHEKITDLAAIAKSLNCLGELAVALGQWDKGQEYHAKALQLFKKLGDRGYIGVTLNYLGNVLKERGDLALAERHFREALKIEHSTGDRYSTGTALNNLGDTLLRRGQLPEALQMARASLAIFENSLADEKLTESYRLMGEIMLTLKQWPLAKKQLANALMRARSANNKPQLATIFCSISRLHQSSGNLQQAEKTASRAVEIVTGTMYQIEIARSQLQHATILKLLGQSSEAVRAERQAWTIFSQLGIQQKLTEV